MLSGKQILVAEDNEWIAEALVQTITDYRGDRSWPGADERRKPLH